MHFLLFVFTVLSAAPVQAQTAVDGYKAYDAGDYETAKSIILPLVEQGDPIAMNAMGNFYSEGKAYTENPTVACNWYEKAAKADYPAAQYNFSNCFHEWGGREKSIKTYLFWLRKAAEQSYLYAQLKLMFWYMDTNRDLAKKWGEKAALQDNAVAKVALWMTNLDDNIPPVHFSEITCVFFNNMLLDRGWMTCDN